MPAASDVDMQAPRRQRRRIAHAGGWHQPIAAAGDPQAGQRQAGERVAQVGVFEQAQALLQCLQRGFAACIQGLLERAQFLARMFGADRVQGEEAFQRAAIVAPQVLAELQEYRRFDRMRPIIATHEPRRRGDQRQALHLRRCGSRLHREQTAQRPAQPDRRRGTRQELCDARLQFQRRGRIAAVAVAGQIHQMQRAAIGQPLDQRREHAAVQGPAMNQNQRGAAARDFDMHALRGREKPTAEPAG